MVRSVRAALCVLVVAVVLAGCGAVDSGGGTADRAATTLTPAPIPEETGPAGGRLLAPGLSARGIFDADVLVEGHRKTLTERGFVLTRNRTVFRPNGTGEPRALNTMRRRIVVGPGAESYHFTRIERSAREWPVADTYTLIGVWYREPVVRNRFADESRVEHYWGGNETESGRPVFDPTQAGGVRRDLVAVDLRVVGNGTASEDGGAGGVPVYRLEGSRFEEPAELVFPALLSNPHDVSMVARIDERGVVRSYTLTFDATFDGGPVRVRRTHRVAAIGETTVDRPGWLSKANESVANEEG